MNWFINNAIAQQGAGAGRTDSTMSILMMVGIFVLFYFMLIRPQSKRAKEHRNMVTNLKNGDEIITTGGVIGKIVKIHEQSIDLNIAKGVDIKLQRNSVSAVLPKGTINTL